jgi:hypothetical protein
MGNLNSRIVVLSREIQQKMNVEGPMFVVERTATPKYRFVILSRKSTERYFEDITPELELQLQLPYVMYLHRASSTRPDDEDQIYGVWFYNNVQSLNFVDLISRLNNTSPLTTQDVPQTTILTTTTTTTTTNDAADHLKTMLGLNQPQQKTQQHDFLNPLEQFVKQHNISFSTQKSEMRAVYSPPPPQNNQRASRTNMLQQVSPPRYLPSFSPPTVVPHRVSPSLLLYQPQTENMDGTGKEIKLNDVKDLLSPTQFIANTDSITDKLPTVDRDPTRQEFRLAIIQLLEQDDEYVDRLYKMYMLARKFGKM